MDNEKLIKLVSEHSNLWDNRLTTFHDENASANEWQDVANKLNETVTAVRTRWRHLRESFSRAYANMLTKTDDLQSLEDSETPKWAYFNQMYFLKEVSGPESTDNVQDKMQVEPNTDVHMPEFDPIVQINGSSEQETRKELSVADDDYHLEEEHLEEDDDDYVPSSKQKKRGAPRKPAKKSAPKRKTPTKKKAPPVKVKFDTKRNSRSLATQKEKELKQPLPHAPVHIGESKQTENNNSQDYHFLMSLLPCLEQLPLRNKMLVKLEMQQLLYEATFDEPLPSNE